MNVNFYQYDKYIIYILYTIYYNTYFVMVPGRLCISVSILSDTESSVCIRCLIPLQRYLISLMLSSRTEQRRQSECKKKQALHTDNTPFKAAKLMLKRKSKSKATLNFGGSEEDIFIKYCIQTLSRRIRGSRKRIEINIGDWIGFYDPDFNN